MQIQCKMWAKCQVFVSFLLRSFDVVEFRTFSLCTGTCRTSISVVRTFDHKIYEIHLWPFCNLNWDDATWVVRFNWRPSKQQDM